MILALIYLLIPPNLKDLSRHPPANSFERFCSISSKFLFNSFHLFENAPPLTNHFGNVVDTFAGPLFFASASDSRLSQVVDCQIVLFCDDSIDERILHLLEPFLSRNLQQILGSKKIVSLSWNTGRVTSH